MMEPKQILKDHISKVIPLNDEQFDSLFSLFSIRTFRKGEAVIKEGDRVQGEYFVLDGALKSFYINDDLKMSILQFAMPTWWISDYEALYSGERATIGVDCITDATALYITNSDREKACKELHAVEHFFRWRTNKGYVSVTKRLLSFMNNDAKHRYEALMKQYPQLYNLVPKHLIAAYLGVSRETLSRLYNS